MRIGGNHDHQIVRPQAFGQIVGDGLDELLVPFVELDDVPRGVKPAVRLHGRRGPPFFSWPNSPNGYPRVPFSMRKSFVPVTSSRRRTMGLAVPIRTPGLCRRAFNSTCSADESRKVTPLRSSSTGSPSKVASQVSISGA